MLLGQSDFVIEDPIQLNLPDYPKLSSTQMLYQNNMNFLVQPPLERQPEKNIGYVLDTATWALFLASLLIVTAVFSIISALNVRQDLIVRDFVM